MPRTSKGSKKSQKPSNVSARATTSSNGANAGSPSINTGQNEEEVRHAVNGVAGQTSAGASPSEQPRVMGARMSGVKHSGLLAKDEEER